VFAPETVKLVVAPKQIVAGLDTGTSVGDASAETVIVAELAALEIQP